MEIRLKETELKEAVVLWIENEGFTLDNKAVKIDFTAGRAPNGFSAEVETFKLDPEEVVEETTSADEDKDFEPETLDNSPFVEEPQDGVSVVGTQPALDLDLD